MAKVQIELDEAKLTELVLDYLSRILQLDLVKSDIIIEVKSKQNYKSEWESAAFRVRVEKIV